VDRVFLDANVIFSAAYDARSRITGLWRLQNLRLFTSDYALAEVIRNLQRKAPARVQSLAGLLSRMSVIASPTIIQPLLPADLSAKDEPILQAAIACRANYLLTGDSDFVFCFGRVIEGVLILRPADYIRLRIEG
jgi:predicted nucleic acid-binding protein